MSSTYTDRNNPCSRWTSVHSQFWYYFTSKVRIKKLPRIVFPITTRLMDDNIDFVQEVPQDHQYLRRIFLPFICRGRRIHTSGHSDLGIMSFLGASSNLHLGVGRYCISCLSVTIWYSCNNIHYLCGSHLGCRRALLSKNCVGTRVVCYNVPSEHDSAFVFL